ncbi:beta-lactamase/transpeptidase-like protein [Hyaloscypha variabilis F]|uniref:Beta-lactamase/transpeptidase-like protein n=1 Tax=Hyaloscypha variabilis (strain UAMH 11265 / GT02V1 / F) TaxID=1149755 RepID=A0A2J6QYV7_HYAVF|nr:beta-lactamase/transpeptidase-like protein [Hyaloscypha variabilis F]
MAQFIAWHGSNLAQHEQHVADGTKLGYSWQSLSIHDSVTDPHYSGVMIQQSPKVAQRAFPTLTAVQLEGTLEAQRRHGYGPVIIAATGTSSDPLFAAVFAAGSQNSILRFGLITGDESVAASIQSVNRIAQDNGQIPLWLAVYGDANDPRFAGIWVSNTDKVAWNADGLVESAGDYQTRFNVQTSAWCRPALVPVSPDGNFMSLFVDNRIGPWQARHNLTFAQYQAEFDNWTKQGFFPANVQGGGSGSATRYSALFVKSVQPVQKQWTTTGPVTNAEIDLIIGEAMMNSPVRHASLAIIHGTTLVYARGYTYAEPSWPVVQPTTFFRQASCSKMATALAIYQLIENNQLNLSDRMQDILELQTPTQVPPTDPRFNTITIQHLLEHTSGLVPNAADTDLNCLNAFLRANPLGNWVLPVSADMTNSYIASLSLASDPGTAQVYNNCGYYLLGRILSAKHSIPGTPLTPPVVPAPIDVFKQYLFAPLKISHIRQSDSVLQTTLPDEARYRSHEIPLLRSVMSPLQPLVPAGYGDGRLDDKEGSGGLSAATTDMARLLAILLKTTDGPALKRSTITTMLNNAAANFNRWRNPTVDFRVGHGFDEVEVQQGGTYHAQKGGQMTSTDDVNSTIVGTVVQIDGEWGFALSWAGWMPNTNGFWYPDYPTVMNAVKAATWGPADLFPSFGMPSL